MSGAERGTAARSRTRKSDAPEGAAEGEGVPAGGGRWSAVLFDLDGTLADTIPLILACYRHTMLRHRGRELPDGLWLEHVGRPLHDSMAEFATDPVEVEAMLRTYATRQRELHDGMVAAFPGAADLLDALRSLGARLGVVTSKRREIAARTLGCCGLGAMFDVVITPEDVSRGKPDPEPVLLALRLLELDEARENVLFVGDSPYDIAAGRDAGVRTAAATWGPFDRERLERERPDFVIDRLEEVLRIG